jgi:hypothetical protein
MGLRDELENVDCRRLGDIFTDLLENPASFSAAFMEREVAFADTIPALRLLFDRMWALGPALRERGMSEDRFRDIIVGLDAARIVLAAHALTEMTDSPDC